MSNTNDTDTFVNEVDEKMREERMLAIAKRYGPWAIGAFVAFLLVIGGWQAWEAYSRGQSRQTAEAFAAAQQLARGENLDAAKTAFEELSREGPDVYRVMARMERAAILAQQGDLEAALAEFDAAAEAARDPVMRQTAQLRAAYIAAETQDYEALQTRLNPLIESNTRISFLARELLGIEAWEAGRLDEARPIFENLTLALDAPDAVRQRAQIALNVIGPAPAAENATPPQAPAPGETK